MARDLAKRLQWVIDLLEEALEDQDWGKVEEALDELRGLKEEVEG